MVSGFVEEAGFSSQESGVRSQNEEHLLSADCLLPTAYCLLPSAYDLLHMRGVQVGGTLAPFRSLRHDVTGYGEGKKQ